MLTGIKYLENLSEWDGKRSNFDLGPFCAVLAELGNPQEKVPAIHVAGTNGKGTVCAALSSILKEAGFSVGQFSSPHLVSVTERTRVNGKPVSEEEYSRAIDTVVAAGEKLGIQLSYFEMTTVVSFLLFAEKKLDWMVIEVGLGGRLDSTNVLLKPRATVITSIGLEHTAILGETLALIAREKAGICKEGAPLFVGEVSDEALSSISSVFFSVVNEKDAPLEVSGKDFVLETDTLICKEGRFTFSKEAKEKLPGYLFTNAVLATRVAKFLGVPDSPIERGLLNFSWPGRLDLRRIHGIPVLFDVAHNVDGIQALISFLKGRQGCDTGDLTFLLSIVSDKNYLLMLNELKTFKTECDAKGLPVTFIFTHSGNPRALSPEKLQSAAGCGEIIADPQEAFQQALKRSQSGMVVVTGSLFLVGKLISRSNI